MEFKVNSWMLEAAECGFEGNRNPGSKVDSVTLIEMPARAARCRFVPRSRPQVHALTEPRPKGAVRLPPAIPIETLVGYPTASESSNLSTPVRECSDVFPEATMLRGWTGRCMPGPKRAAVGRCRGEACLALAQQYVIVIAKWRTKRANRFPISGSRSRRLSSLPACRAAAGPGRALRRERRADRT